MFVSEFNQTACVILLTLPHFILYPQLLYNGFAWTYLKWFGMLTCRCLKYLN